MRSAHVLALALTGLAGQAMAAPVPQAAPPQSQPLAAPPDVQVEDPLEGFNRAMFGVDLAVNRLLAGRGRILVFAKWVPAPVREGLYNAFTNLQEPSTFANDVLQKKMKRAGETAARFGVNSTIGGLGVVDVASRLGIKRNREDFGQTLAIWGVSPGPYVYVPFSGPTTFRDTLAGVVDGYFVPGRWFPMTGWERRGMGVIRFAVSPSTIGIRQVARGAAEAGETPDEYATLRLLYYDQRADQIADRPNLADNPVEAEPEKQKPKPQ
jgi:phospholipid-binding lipoprotein MlaA